MRYFAWKLELISNSLWLIVAWFTVISDDWGCIYPNVFEKIDRCFCRRKPSAQKWPNWSNCYWINWKNQYSYDPSLIRCKNPDFFVT